MYLQQILLMMIFHLHSIEGQVEPHKEKEVDFQYRVTFLMECGLHILIFSLKGVVHIPQI